MTTTEERIAQIRETNAELSANRFNTLTNDEVRDFTNGINDLIDAYIELERLLDE